jgi:branched-chain amino acid transport system substrate-binding protein
MGVKDRRTKSTRRSFLSLAAAGGAVALAGCSGGGGGGGSGGNTATLGSLNPMSGAYSSLGPNQRAGVELAVEQVNNSDEFEYGFETVFKDTATEAGTAQQVAQQAVQQDDADFIMGAISSSVALSLNEFAASEEVVYFSGGAAVPITGSACNEWVYRFETNTAQIAEAISDYTVNELGRNVWFHIADYAYGDSVYQRTRQRMRQGSNSFTEVGQTASELGSSNFGSFISQISNSDADAVMLGMLGGDLVSFVNQAANRGLTDEVNIVAPTMTIQSTRQALGEQGVGTFGGLRYNANIDIGDNAQFVEAFQEANDGRLPDNFERTGYESVRYLAAGMQEAQSTDPADVRDALEGMTRTTVLGEVTLRESDHQATVPTWMAEMVPSDDGTPAVEVLSRSDDNLPPASELGCEMS